jgi:hypothetical protein
MRNFEDVDGVDITRRCWDSSDKEEDNGTGESGEGNESAEKLRFEVRDSEAGDGNGNDSGGGRARLVSAAVATTKLDLKKYINPKKN